MKRFEINLTTSSTLISLQIFLSILTITSLRYFVHKLLGKMENSTFLTQICLKNDLGLGFQKAQYKNKNYLRITTSILEI